MKYPKKKLGRPGYVSQWRDTTSTKKHRQELYQAANELLKKHRPKKNDYQTKP